MQSIRQMIRRYFITKTLIAHPISFRIYIHMRFPYVNFKIIHWSLSFRCPFMSTHSKRLFYSVICFIAFVQMN